MAYLVLRTNTRTDDTLTSSVGTEREARRLIFYCALDNCGMSRKDATLEANGAIIGEPYVMRDYVFTIGKV